MFSIDLPATSGHKVIVDGRKIVKLFPDIDSISEKFLKFFVLVGLIQIKCFDTMLRHLFYRDSEGVVIKTNVTYTHVLVTWKYILSKQGKTSAKLSTPQKHSLLDSLDSKAFALLLCNKMHCSPSNAFFPKSTFYVLFVYLFIDSIINLDCLMNWKANLTDYLFTKLPLTLPPHKDSI